MVTDYTRNQIWQELWDSERFVLYFSDLADAYRRRHQIMRLAIIFAVFIEATVTVIFASLIASLGVAGIWINIFVVLITLLGITIAALGAGAAISDYTENATILGWVSDDCKSLNTQWGELWQDIETFAIGEHQARDRRRELLKGFDAITARIQIVLDKNRNESSAEAAVEILRKKYGYMDIAGHSQRASPST